MSAVSQIASCFAATRTLKLMKPGINLAPSRSLHLAYARDDYDSGAHEHFIQISVLRLEPETPDSVAPCRRTIWADVVCRPMVHTLLQMHHIRGQPAQIQPMTGGYLAPNLQCQPNIQQGPVGHLLFPLQKIPVQSRPCHWCPLSCRIMQTVCHCYHGQVPVAQDHPCLLHQPFRLKHQLRQFLHLCPRPI